MSGRRNIKECGQPTEAGWYLCYYWHDDIEPIENYFDGKRWVESAKPRAQELAFGNSPEEWAEEYWEPVPVDWKN